MWRSFFLAVGVFTILVGLETMVVDQVMMTNVRRIPKMVTGKARELVNATAPAVAQNQPVAAGSQSPYQMPTFNRPANVGPNGRPSTSNTVPSGYGMQSPYRPPGPATNGPTQYRGTQSANFNRVLDSSGRDPAERQPRFGFASFQKRGNDTITPPVATAPPAAMAPPAAVVPAVAKRPRIRPSRIIQTKDWMPWSLFAAGTITILFTQSRERFGQ